METARLVTRVDAELHRQVKILAAREGTTIEALLSEAIKALLEGRPAGDDGAGDARD